ncbi:MAG: LacI family DNA-binding transcriptional regulator [Flavisolibacter sp.]
MKFESATIKDIAKALNLSPSTVSRALRGSHEISVATKTLVLDYARKIHYRPTPAALSLKEKRTRSLGVVVCEIANNFFSEAINGIESIAYDKGYHVIITQSHESVEREQANAQHLASHGVDGLLISLSSESAEVPHLKELFEKGLPIVFFDRVTNEIPTHQVIANNYQGAFQATEHLILQGFKHIGHITSSPLLSITRERLKGYKEALQKHHLPFRESFVTYCHQGGLHKEETEAAMKQLFKGRQKPDAIFAATDRITTHCFGILKKMGRSRELGFTGFTNTQLGDLLEPALTRVRQPAFEMGQRATALLIEMIESKRPQTEYTTGILETELIIRASSLRKPTTGKS